MAPGPRGPGASILFPAERLKIIPRRSVCFQRFRMPNFSYADILTDLPKPENLNRDEPILVHRGYTNSNDAASI